METAGDELLDGVFLGELVFAFELPDVDGDVELHLDCVGVADSVETGQHFDGSQVQAVAFLYQVDVNDAIGPSASLGQLYEEPALFLDFSLVLLEETDFDEFVGGWQYSQSDIPVLGHCLDLQQQSQQGLLSQLSCPC